MPAPETQQPSAKWCFVCGVENPCGLHIRFFEEGPGRVLARFTLGDAYQSYPGIAHGGILATVLDETMGRAVLATGSEDGVPRFMVTARLEIRYRHPVPLHQELTARGWIEHDRGRSAQVAGEIALPDGTIAAEGQAAVVAIRPEQIRQMMDEDVGWQVYE